MENRYNKYKNIIERAILAGIISEDSRQTYFSGIEEENESELSESIVNMEKDENSYSHYHPENRLINKTEFNKNRSENKRTEMTVFDCHDNHSTISESTVENYSILDSKIPKTKNSITNDSLSETSPSKHENVKPEKSQDLKSIIALSKAVKKPTKDQILDFNIPIYMDVKKKNSLAKSSILNSENVTLYEISKVHCGKRDAERFTKKNFQDSNKWAYPKSKIIVARKKDTSSKKAKNFAHNNLFKNCTDENHGDQTGHNHRKDKSVKKNVQSFYSREKVTKSQRENPELISKYFQSQSDRNVQQYSRQICTAGTHRKLEVKDNLITTKLKYEPKENNSIDSETYESVDNNENEGKTQISVPVTAEICKPHEFSDFSLADNTRPLNNQMTEEKNNEAMVSAQSISKEKDFCVKDHRNFLKVNITCKFYDDDETISSNASIQCYETANDAFNSSLKKTKACGEIVNENGKSKKNNKIQFLSRLFTNMKSKKRST